MSATDATGGIGMGLMSAVPIIGAIPGIISAIVGANSSADYQKKLEELRQQQHLAAGYKRGENIYKELSNEGLPGYESQESELDTSIPTTLNQMKDYVSSGSLVDAVAGMSAKVNQQKRQLGAANDAALLQNKQSLGNYESSVMGPAETKVADDKTQLAIGGAYEKMQGTSNSLGWMNQIVGGAESMFKNPEMAKYFAAMMAKNKGGNMGQSLNPYAQTKNMTAGFADSDPTPQGSSLDWLTKAINGINPNSWNGL